MRERSTFCLSVCQSVYPSVRPGDQTRRMKSSVCFSLELGFCLGRVLPMQPMLKGLFLTFLVNRASQSRERDGKLMEI